MITINTCSSRLITILTDSNKSVMCQNKMVLADKKIKQIERINAMAALARIYGLRTYTKREIRKSEEYVMIDHDCYMSEGEYAMLEDIIAENNND